MVKVFLTQFPLDNKGSLDDLVEISKNWIKKSPHVPDKFKERVDSLKSLKKDVHKEAYKDYVLEIRKIHTENSEFFGLRYNYPLNNDLWMTTMTAERKDFPKKTDIAIQIDYFSKEEIKPKAPKKPNLIRLVLEKIGGGRDGDLDVKEEPYFLKNGDEEFVADFLSGNSKNTMPIIYLSRDYEDNILIKNPKRFAMLLSGIAHVFVEPKDKRFSLNLRDFMNGKNVFGGAIGVYWPEIHRRNYWLPGAVLKTDRFSENVFQHIVQGLITRKLKDELTWENFRKIHLERRINELRKKEKKSSEDFEELFYTYEEETKRLKEELEEQKKINYTLDLRLKSKSLRNNFFLEFNELYPGERTDVLREAVESAFRSTPKGSRKRKILMSFLNQNSGNSFKEQLKKRLKDILQKNRKMDSRLIGHLEGMGFSVEKTKGGHYKVYASVDKSVFSTFPSTPGDNRSWDNSISDFLKKFF